MLNVFHYTSRTLTTFVENEGQLCSAEDCPVFSPVRLLFQKLYLASGVAFKISFAHRYPEMISAGGSNLES